MWNWSEIPCPILASTVFKTVKTLPFSVMLHHCRACGYGQVPNHWPAPLVDVWWWRCPVVVTVKEIPRNLIFCNKSPGERWHYHVFFRSSWSQNWFLIFFKLKNPGTSDLEGITPIELNSGIETINPQSYSRNWFGFSGFWIPVTSQMT